MCNSQGALQFIWILIYQNFKISHRCFLEIFNLKRILSRLFLRFVLAMPEFCNNRVILTANYIMTSKPIFLQVSPTVCLREVDLYHLFVAVEILCTDFYIKDN